MLWEHSESQSFTSSIYGIRSWRKKESPSLPFFLEKGKTLRYYLKRNIFKISQLRFIYGYVKYRLRLFLFRDLPKYQERKKKRRKKKPDSIADTYTLNWTVDWRKKKSWLFIRPPRKNVVVRKPVTSCLPRKSGKNRFRISSNNVFSQFVEAVRMIVRAKRKS